MILKIRLIKRKKKNIKKINGEVHSGVHLINKKEIVIEKGAIVKPGVVIDASEGSGLH
jgi:hypothetical protein